MTWAERDTYVEEVTRDVFAFIQPDGSWMVNNCGFVVGSSGRSVLVADDEPLNQEIARILLEDVGLTVETANDGAEAVAMCASR